jgi:16S rRNA (cytosine967-C5)-methyltransferase
LPADAIFSNSSLIQCFCLSLTRSGIALLKIVSAKKPREIAVEVLAQRQGGRFVEDLLEKALGESRLATADRGLCQELVYGVVRWQLTLDWLIERKTPNRKQKPALQDLLRLGLYQIFWLERIPAHAAVHETVELAKQRGFGPQAGFVNAVLRGYLRDSEGTRQSLAGLKINEPAVGYSHPAWLVARWTQSWGPQATAELMSWNNTPPKTFARVNTLKTDAGKLLEQWRQEDVDYDFVRHDWLTENLVFELKAHPSISLLPSFQQGLFYIQDPSTLLAVQELDPQPGEAIVDFCAAPGGKLTFIAQLLRNEGRLVAYDTSPQRLRMVQENCARLGVNCVTVAQAEFNVQSSKFNVQGSADSAAPGDQLLRPASFDKVLLDAPCSNTGVMRRRVDLRWRIHPDEIERLRATQIDLLNRAATLLKPGGRLVYSTCSLEPEENGAVVSDFLATQPGFKLERARELRPFADGVDGAYVACLKR